MPRITLAALVVLAFCLFLRPAPAQVFYGTVVGTVEDAAGSVIPSAVVTVSEKSTGLKRQTVTNDTGGYQFADLIPGVYELTVQAPGFTRLTQTDVRVSINNVTRTDVRLQLSTIAESITVSAAAAQLQTDKPDVHVDLGSKEVTALPLPGYRNFQSLVNLVPGSTPGRFQNTIFGSPGRSLSVNLNGANRNNNNTRLDGATNIRVGLPHQIRYVPPTESIETVNISTNNFDAEQGFAGGAAIAIATKSGTNAFHGVMFEHHTNNRLYAKDFFYQDANKPKAILNMFGGTFGGPIQKDKLFFFSSWERLRQRDNFSKLVTVSTADQRAGDFSAYGVRLYDPLTGAANGAGRTLFPDSIVPISRQSAITRKMQSLIPAPNLRGLNANYFASAPVVLDRDNFDGKLNWNESAKNTLWVKYSRMPARAVGQFSLGPAGGTGMTDGGGLGTSDFLAQFATFGINHTFSPAFLVDGVVGFGRDSYGNPGPDFGKNYGLEFLGIPGTNGKDIRASGLPTFSISGYEVLGGGVPWMPQYEDDSSLTYTTNFGWMKGKHDIRFGTDIARYWVSAWKPEQGGRGSRGQFAFDGGVTALNGGPSPNQYNSYAAFLLGLPQSFGKSIQFYEPMTTHQWMEGLYFRDRWQPLRNLTLTMGLRWEYYPLYSRPDTGLERYDAASNQVLIGGKGSVPQNAGVTVSKKLFAPRFGLAYRLGQKGVIRTGYGISIDPTPLVRVMRGNYPAVVNQDFIGPNSFQPYGPIENGIPLFTGPDIGTGRVTLPLAATTTTLGQGLFRRGYIQSFNFVLERQLPGGFVGSTGYIGTHTVRQAVVWNINAAPPGGGSNGRPYAALYGRTVDTSLYTNFPSAGYHSWQNQLDRRFSAGLMLKFAYTWSKAINWTSDSQGSLSFNTPSALWHNRAMADFDRTHTFRIAWLSELPFGKGKRWGNSNPAAQALLGGWEVNGIFSAYSGQPFTISASTASLNAPGNSQTADQVKPEVKQLGGIGRDVPFFDPLAFRPVTEVRFGNTGRNILRGPGVVNVDTGIFRNFRLTERWKLQFRAESFNLTNTPHFANPSGNVSNMSLNPDGTIRSLGNFMAVTSTASGSTNAEGFARQFRFGLRVSF